MRANHKRIIRRIQGSEEVNIFSHLHPLLQRIYATRQVKSSQELENDLSHLLTYQSLLGIEQAVLLLTDAIVQQKRFLIVGDFDADGATSTAVAIRALRKFGAMHVNFLVPNRFAFGYGLTPELIASIQGVLPEVIITVDNGIANHAGVAAAKALGMTVIITDHHLAAQTLPLADAIVNPNQPHDLFPSKYLAGVGVIFYVMLALRAHLVKTGWFEQQKISVPKMSHLLDIVALGTVADLVPLDWNNRIIVRQGLNRIRTGQCVPGIVALLELANRDFRRVVAADLGFAVAARLNAAGRLDDMSLGIECLLTDDPVKARELAKTLDQLNQARRTIEQDMQAQALESLNQFSEPQTEMPIGLCLFDESWHQGVIGILAARIKDRFHRPVIVFAEGTTNELKGSARSIPDLHIRDTLALIDVQYPGLIIKFGGHAMAAGLTINKERFQDFADIFNQMIKRQMTEEQLQHSLLSDGALALDEFNLEVAVLLREGGPWGQAFPEPLFDDVFLILDQRLIKDKHLKLRLSKEKKVLEAMAFFVNTEMWPNHRCRAIHAAYRLDVNEYKGRSDIQLIIEHLVPVE